MFKNIFYNNFSNTIHLWETYNGETSYLKKKYEYIYYIKSNKESKIKDIYGNYVIEQKTNSKKKIKELKNANVELLESDILEEISFLQRRYNKIKLNPSIEQFNIAYLDIETEYEDSFPKPQLALQEINLITISDNNDNVFTWGKEPYSGKSKVKYFHIKNEKERLEHFVKFFKKQKYDIITGWNVKDFDIQYILNRLDRLKITKSLSPINNIYKNIKKDNKGNESFYCSIAGVSILDYMELYKKFTFVTLESYSLNFVSKHEELEGKLEFEGQLNDVYKNDWNKFVEYNIQDVMLVKGLEKNKRFIDLTIKISSESLIPLEKVFSSVLTIEGYILRTLHSNNLVMPDRKENKTDIWRDLKLYKTERGLQNVFEDQKSFYPFYVKGGHVESNPGFYKNVLSFDVESLYPSNIIQYNISPETKIFNPNDNQKENLIKTSINGLYYKKELGILPIIVKKIFEERKRFKKEMEKYANLKDKDKEKYYDSQQHIRKILINSIYGVMIQPYFHFYDVDNARAITRGGRTLIKFLAASVNKYFKECWHKVGGKIFKNNCNEKIEKNVVVLIDTDSNHYCLDEIKEKYAKEMDFVSFSKIMEKMVFEPLFDKLLSIWAKKHNTNQEINFKREGIILKEFVLAKKKYLSEILVQENVVYEKSKLKTIGVEIKRSDTPKFCRNNIEKIVKKMFEGDYPNKELILAELKKIKKEFKKQNINDISFNSSVNEYTKYADDINNYIKNKSLFFKKATPIHVRASMCYNYMIKNYKLPYMEISNNSKVKFIYVKNENTLTSNVIGFVGNYPKEFNKYFSIDYDLQFEKSFLGIVQRMFNVLNWGNVNLKTNDKLKLFME